MLHTKELHQGPESVCDSERHTNYFSVIFMCIIWDTICLLYNGAILGSKLRAEQYDNSE